MSVAVGDKAPGFTLLGSGGKSYSLSDYAGKPVVLVFYPGDNTPVCTKQLCSYNNELAQFTDIGAQVLGISAQDVEATMHSPPSTTSDSHCWPTPKKRWQERMEWLDYWA